MCLSHDPNSEPRFRSGAQGPESLISGAAAVHGARVFSNHRDAGFAGVTASSAAAVHEPTDQLSGDRDVILKTRPSLR